MCALPPLRSATPRHLTRARTKSAHAQSGPALASHQPHVGDGGCVAPGRGQLLPAVCSHAHLGSARQRRTFAGQRRACNSGRMHLTSRVPDAAEAGMSAMVEAQLSEAAAAPMAASPGAAERLCDTPAPDAEAEAPLGLHPMGMSSVGAADRACSARVADVEAGGPLGASVDPWGAIATGTAGRSCDGLWREAQRMAAASAPAALSSFPGAEAPRSVDRADGTKGGSFQTCGSNDARASPDSGLQVVVDPRDGRGQSSRAEDFLQNPRNGGGDMCSIDMQVVVDPRDTRGSTNEWHSGGPAGSLLGSDLGAQRHVGNALRLQTPCHRVSLGSRAAARLRRGDGELVAADGEGFSEGLSKGGAAGGCRAAFPAAAGGLPEHVRALGVAEAAAHGCSAAEAWPARVLTSPFALHASQLPHHDYEFQ